MSSETITPKANRRILDAQLVDDESPTGFTSSFETLHQSTPHSQSSSSQSSASILGRWLPKKFSDYLQLLLGLMVLGLILVLWSKQQDQDWQIEQINQLQSQVAQLLHAQESLQSSQIDLQQALERQQQAALTLENKPLVSVADLDNLKTQWNEKLQALESQISEFSQSAQSQGKTVLEEAQKTLQDWLVNQNSHSATESGETQSNPLPEALQQRLQSMGEQITDLFAFKDQQLQQSEQAPVSPAPLNEMLLQKWILEINTQWLLAGNAMQTQQQLQALEQAAGLSDFSQKLRLMRFIGEDLVRLEAMKQANFIGNPQAANAIKTWLTLQAQAAGSAAASTAKTPAVAQTVIEESAQGAEAPSAWQRLQQAFASVFTLKKRESEQDLTRVERTLMQDVLLQRAYLIIEQLEWAMQLQSEVKKQQALSDLKAMIQHNWPNANLAELAGLLKPFEEVQFAVLQPLSVVNAL